MGRELNLLAKYPRARRDTSARAAEKTAEDVAIARRFGREFFDGERRHGYGGYSASPERWRGVAEDIFYAYEDAHSFLDVGCAKGGLLLALKEWFFDAPVPLSGIDISRYAIESAPDQVKPHVIAGCATDLPWGPQSFDLAISINTIHNLDRAGCIKALRELMRVSRHQYVTLDAYRTEAERQRMLDWNLTALTILHADEWLKLFAEAGYTGDYGFWMP